MERAARKAAIIFLCMAARLHAEEGPLNLTVGLRSWGADCSVAYRIAELREGWPTRLWLSAGGGYESGHLYRSFDGTDTVGEHVSPPVASDTGKFQNLDFDVALGASQGFAAGVHELGLFLLGTFRYERRDASWAPEALIFSSALPDREGMTETALLVGAQFRRTIRPGSAGRYYPFLYSLEGSLRLAPRWLLNAVADYTRFSAIATGQLQLVNARMLELYLVARAGFDTMWGTSYPVHARTTVGGIGLRFFTLGPGLGGAVRGITEGRFDGTTKLYANLDVRLLFPVTTLFVPAVTVFADGGVSDYRRLDHTLASADILYTTGVNVSAIIAKDAQIGYTLSYAPGEPDPARRFGHSLTYSAQF